MLGCGMVFPLFVSGAPTRCVSCSIEPSDQDNFASAHFHLCLPAAVEKPSYLLVLVPGINGDGRTMLAEGHPWLAFAEETRAVVLACSFQSLSKDAPNYRHYAAARNGSGHALEKALDRLTREIGQPDWNALPLLFYGFSAGGQFAYGFSCHQPKRMLGFVAVKGGYYFPQPVEGTYDVPALLIAGARDLPRRREAIRRLFQDNTSRGAPWTLHEDRGGHDESSMRAVVLPWIRALLARHNPPRIDPPKHHNPPSNP